MAKANAYGLGDRQICSYLNDEVDYFAVSSDNEFLRLKKYVTKPILILDPIYKNITKCAKGNAELCVSNLNNFNLILKAAKRNKDINFKIHIAINTGMNRFGFSNKRDIVAICKTIKKVQNISLLGVFSHYYEANNKNIANLQTKKFLNFKKLICDFFNEEDIIFHMSASSGLWLKNKCNMVRVGIAVYNNEQNFTLKLKSKIIQFQHVKKCDTAGYNSEFLASKNTKLAVVSIGYADGIFRKIVKSGSVLINDKFCKIVAICMDSIFVDVSNLSCNINDDVTIIGKDKSNQIFVCDLASWCDTISYEILTHITSRVKRKYIRG